MLYKTLSAAVYGHAPARTPRYNSMQDVALGQAWSKERAAKLFGQAIAFEPS